MGHALPGLRAMPVLGVRRDERDDAGGQVVLLGLGRDDAVAFGHEKDLIGRMHVPAVAGAVLEVDLRQTKVLAVLPTDGGECVDLPREDLGDALGPLFTVRFQHPHASIVAQVPEP